MKENTKENAKDNEAAILEGLNDEQLKAVTHAEGPLLIIAGAGTGKTTVVTRRIAHLIQSGLAKSEEILALTFTDKAAGEMEERVQTLLPVGFFDMWISTFHSFGDRILKDHALDIGLSNNYALLSETEQWLLLREHIDTFELDYYKPKGNPTKFVQALISHFSRLKDEDITPQEYLAYAEQLQLDTDAEFVSSKDGLADEDKAKVDEAQRVMEVAKAYMQYQKILHEKSALDFGDLIVETIHLFKERPAILEQYRRQFTYILVDEFQDTNFAQYELIKMLAGPRNNLTVVADDDQSIYSFRGASMSNILIFKKDYPESTEVSLIQNYRSAQEILDLAYDFIQHNNPNRLEKTINIDKHLQSNKEVVGIIEHLHSDSLEGEAQLVLHKIQNLMAEDSALRWDDIAILVRANDHAEAFIPYLERAQIPYQFLASRGLFAKPIILDVMAFLKLLDNYHESRAVYRVLTYAHWNIPQGDIIDILHYGTKHTESLYETCTTIRSVTGLDEKTYTTVESIIGLIQRLTTAARTQPVGQVVLRLLEESGYLQTITSEETEEATEAVLYLNQFYSYIEAFERANPEKSVRNFVFEMNAMIDSGEEGRLSQTYEDGPETVKILTVHASKGLEFEHVFIVNLVDKRFPSIGRKETIPIPDAIVKDVVPEGNWHLEEERRLFYVAMTRAKKGLYLASGEDYGGARRKKPSRFLIESGFVDTKPEPTGKVVLTEPAQPISRKKQEDVARVPSTFSFTQLKAYETCPWQYRFAFLLKVPVPGKASFSFGKTMHNTLYEFFRRMKEQNEFAQTDLFGSVVQEKVSTRKPLSEKELLDIYEQQWIGEWFASKSQLDEYKKRGQEALKAFYALHKSAWPNVLFLEEGFHASVGEYTLKGAIDRVDQVEGGVEIIDYKTGKFPKNGKKDSEQLYLYALAIKEIFEQDAVKLTYYFIEENKALTIDVDPEAYQKVADWALEMISKILTGDFTPNPGFHCRYCDYREICEYKD